MRGLVNFVRDLYQTDGFIPLHEPRFCGNEKKYLLNCIDSTFVSSVGEFVDLFEDEVAKYTGAKYAIATSNGTSALHASLILADISINDEVITQSLTFVATSNAIRYCNAIPVFLDVDKDTLGLSPISLQTFLDDNTKVIDGKCINIHTDRIVKACVPMHTFGHPCRIDKIKEICEKHHITVIEDSAESLGSFYKNKHTGVYGDMGVLSFNGNKIITTGGGGMILTNNKESAIRAKHITTTAKVPHRWAFEHDTVGYNYRLPNLNAALGLAQIELLPEFLESKRRLALQYQEWGEDNGITFLKEPENCKSNYWLNGLIAFDSSKRDEILDYTNNRKVMTRPLWLPMHMLPMNRDFYRDTMTNTEWLYNRVVNIPSSVIGK